VAGGRGGASGAGAGGGDGGAAGVGAAGGRRALRAVAAGAGRRAALAVRGDRAVRAGQRRRRRPDAVVAAAQPDRIAAGGGARAGGVADARLRRAHAGAGAGDVAGVGRLRAGHGRGAALRAPLGPCSLGPRDVVQPALTVPWSVLGVAGWILGSRRGLRGVWLGGAVLMAVVLAKLVLVDRDYLGNLLGIVSFLAYGLLCTAVGYFAPVPPGE